MDDYVSAGQRWLQQSDVMAKLQFCSLLGINIRTPIKEVYVVERAVAPDCCCSDCAVV